MSENKKRINRELFQSLRKKFQGITKIGIYKKIEKIKKDRGHDITINDAALLLASINGIDISKFADSDKLREIRAIKEDKTQIHQKKTKIVEKDRILQLKNIKISSKDPFITKKIISNSQKMIEYYVLLFILENSLRNLIRFVFKDEENWWDKKIPKGIQDSVKEKIKKEKYFQEKRKDNLEYTHLGNLKEIIIKNWNKFSKVIKLKDKNKFILKIDEIIPSRHNIGHCIILKENDSKRFTYRVEEIFKML